MDSIKTNYLLKIRELIIPVLLDWGISKLSLIFIFTFSFLSAKSQTDSTYSFLVAGHAYGAHVGSNIGLHPPFLNKLTENADSSLMGIFLTGDIVNQSTTASWNQVEKELSDLGLNSYYVMGNHDNNTLGHSVFNEKHGGAYYSFVYKNELYIVLNSTESDRSISQRQLEFLDDVFANTDARWERAFIFFHEVIWNSNTKYRFVRSNSRSRYAQLVNISNFWNEVYPKLTALPEKKFYLFAGDVGGNADAIAASYDRRENVTILSSGMGEVADENYLKVSVSPDTVTFQLIPLNNEVEMKAIEWYNIPEKPDSIFGPSKVSLSQPEVIYKVTPIENATSYRWYASPGISGSSDSAAIILHFADYFQSGKISVVAINDGFGESEPVILEVFADNQTLVLESKNENQFEIHQNQEFLYVDFNSGIIQNAIIKIYDPVGRIVLNEKFTVTQGFNSKLIQKNIQFEGLAIVELIVENKRFTGKILLF
jgi:hypothetical protein